MYLSPVLMIDSFIMYSPVYTSRTGFCWLIFMKSPTNYYIFFGRFLTILKSQEKFAYKTPKFSYIFCFKKEWQPCNQPSTCKTYPDGSLAFPFFILSITHCTPSTTIQHTPPTTLLATEFTPTYFQ